MNEVHFHIHLHDEQSESATRAVLEKILAQLTALQGTEKSLMATVQDIKAQADKALAAIKDESDKDDAIILLSKSNTALITTLKQQLQDAINAGGTPDQLQAVLDTMKAAETSSLANSQKVLDAVNAGTTS